MVYFSRNLKTIFDEAETDKEIDKIQVNNPISPYLINKKLDEKAEAYQQEEKLDQLLKKSKKIIFQCKTVFPFDFFPDRISIDETKVNIILKEFFATESVHGIMIQNIKDIQIQTSIFFASLNIIPDIYFGDPVSINFLHKRDAYEIRRLVQGIIVCQKEGIDLGKLGVEKIKEKVQKVGTAISATV